MKWLGDLLLALSKSVKGRFGYTLTIKQAILFAYFAFLTATFVELTALVKGIYTELTTYWPNVGGHVVQYFPDSIIVSSGITAYIGIITFKKATSYVHDAWQAWIKTTSM